ncbi:hypothetical protein OLEAN_C03590 [Oleispira antarctica RB-8]|uniref:MSHA biogenesis protein MshK n=1 Tax=Oleispira antarctica RB-8 TaxID=698738 RepID=R4YK49_OLEAN|nr:hypothetical protein OLEAN_C03590 [Oleispira antarctica RB-8]
MFNLLKSLLLLSLFSFTSGFAQDPMRPPSWSAESQSERVVNLEPLNLQQVLSSKNRKVAVINDTLVVEGQVIGGAKVAEITDNSVRVIYKGRSIILTMTTTAKEYNREK